MNIIYFIRLLWRHAALLIVIPIITVAAVYFLTENQSRTYISSTKVYTGFTTGSSLSSLEEARVDFYGSKAAFDNLMAIISSRNTAQDIGLILFTRHMLLERPVKEEISNDSYQRLMEIVPEEVKSLVVKDNFNQTYRNFVEYMGRDFNNFIYGLINYEHPHYSSKKIRSNIKVKRVESSDMIEVVFTSDDPGICFQSLKILNNLFINTYTDLEINQSGVVTQYFESQLNEATEKLKNAESELLRFNQESNIINYQEQTKHIASERENFSLEYSRVRMDYASAYSVVKVLESKMTPKARTRLNSQDILDLRKKIADISLKISMINTQLHSNEVADDKRVKELADLNLELAKAQEELRGKVQEQYELDYSTEGIPTSKLIQDWLNQVMLLESTKAKLVVGDQRLKEFDELYTIYAPMGATMKSLERKISVSENEYLSLLNSLGLAKLKQQNKELNSNLKVIEPPLFPLGPQPGKRKYLLLIAMFMGFFIPAFSIVAMEFLDSTIKSPLRAERMTGLKLAAPLPNMASGRRTTNIHFIYSKGIDIVARKLLLGYSDRVDKNEPYTTLLYSHYEGEGKSSLAAQLPERMAEYGYKVLLITYDDVAPKGYHSVKYEKGGKIQNFSKLEDFNDTVAQFPRSYFDFVFVEVPSIIPNLFPVFFIRNADLLLLILRANRSWDTADINALKEIRDMRPKCEPLVVLNGVEVQEMESVLGDLPRNRTFIRRLVKDTLRLRFYSKSRFAPDKKIGK